jgi:hypothetical protein
MTRLGTTQVRIQEREGEGEGETIVMLDMILWCC